MLVVLTFLFLAAAAISLFTFLRNRHAETLSLTEHHLVSVAASLARNYADHRTTDNSLRAIEPVPPPPSPHPLAPQTPPAYCRTLAICKIYLEPIGIDHGLGPVGWHPFRQTYRSWLDETGAPMKVQHELMRHASIQTTMHVYGQTMSSSKREANWKVVEMVLKPMKASA